MVAPGVAVGAPATDEYQLSLPGVEDSGVGGVGGSGTVEGSVSGSEGVVGEDVAPDTALAAFGSMLASPLGIVILAGVMLLAAALLGRAVWPSEPRA